MKCWLYIWLLGVASAFATHVSYRVVDGQLGVTEVSPGVFRAHGVDTAVSYSGTVDVVIVTGNDDAYDPSHGTGTLSLTTARIDMDSSTSSVANVGGFRFQSVGVPSGAVINVAYMVWKPDSTSRDDPELDIFGVMMDSAPGWSSTNRPSTRPITTSTVYYSATGIGAALTNTPSLTSLVSEIVSRPGWASNNSMAFVCKARTNVVTAKVFGPASYNGSTVNMARLHIEWTVGEGEGGGGADSGDLSEYYVDYSNGNDANSGGSTNLAWKHCIGDSSAGGTVATQILNAGDTVYFKSGVSYYGTINMQYSGTSPTHRVTYDGSTWGGGRAIISNRNDHALTTGMMFQAAQSYVTIQGFRFTDIGGYHDTNTPAADGCDTNTTFDAYGGVGIIAASGGRDLIISNCHFAEIGEWRGQDPFDDSTIGGTGVSLQNTTNVVIDGCDFTKMKIGVSVKAIDGAAITNTVIRNSDFHNYLQWCIDVAPRDANNSAIASLSIHDNLIHDYVEYDSGNWLGCGEKPHTDGIFFRTAGMLSRWPNNKIYNNEFYTDATNGGGTAAIYLSQGPSADIYNNTFHNTRHGRTIFMGSGYSGITTQGVNILNNTFYLGNTAINLRDVGTNGPTVGIVILNNIFVNAASSGSGFIMYVEDSNSGPDVLDYNLYHTSNSVPNYINYAGVDSAMTWPDILAQGWEANGYTNAPQFVNISNFFGTASSSNDLRLLTNSWAVDNGTTLTQFSMDKDGVTRPEGAAWDIGAYEFVP